MKGRAISDARTSMQRLPVSDAAWIPTPLVRCSILLHAGSALSALAVADAWPWAAAAVFGNHLVLGAAGMMPRSNLLGDNLTRLPGESAQRGMVALTFDDGPDPAVTPLLLDILDRHGATASFFCVGRKAAAQPALLRDMIAAGHSVENHSYGHSWLFACYGLGALRREATAAQDAIARITGRPPRFFRAPMGLRSPLLDPVLAAMGLRYVSWTRRGFDTVCRDPGLVLRRLTAGVSAGDVLLLHDGGSARGADGRPVVLAVLPLLLRELAARGLRAVSLPEALGEAPVCEASAAPAARPREPAAALTTAR
jgi:peptidoglycan/xylan/chitin deacetylase (PgdA/CDA1 family)